MSRSAHLRRLKKRSGACIISPLTRINRYGAIRIFRIRSPPMKSIHDRASSAREWSVVRLVVAIATLVAMIALPTHGQNLVTNGSFESPSVQGFHNTYVGVDAASLTGWVVDLAGTSIDHVNALWNDAEGFHSIDLNGTEAGSIYQDLATTAAQKYKIRFALAGNPVGYEDKRLEVRWDGANRRSYFCAGGTQYGRHGVDLPSVHRHGR